MLGGSSFLVGSDARFTFFVHVDQVDDFHGVAMVQLRNPSARVDILTFTKFCQHFHLHLAILFILHCISNGPIYFIIQFCRRL